MSFMSMKTAPTRILAYQLQPQFRGSLSPLYRKNFDRHLTNTYIATREISLPPPPSISGQSSRDAEEAAIVEPLEEPSVRGIVAKSPYPSRVSPETKQPAISVFVEKNPFLQSEIEKENDLFCAPGVDKLPAVLIVVKPWPEIDVIIHIPRG